jgi:hypothetical protein
MYPLITTKERLAIWEKARGLWKGRVPEPIREPKKINYSDIPESSDRQLSSMRRVGRPTVGGEPRKLIAIRLDAKVLGWLRKTAEKRSALSIARERDFGQRDAKGELGLI